MIRTLTAAVVDSVLLWRLRPDVGALRHDLAAPQAWVDRVGSDTAAVTLAATALWLVGAWLAVGLSAALVSYAPGALGRAGRRLAQVVLPQVLYRAAAGAAGLGVLLSPIAAGAHTPSGHTPSAHTPSGHTPSALTPSALTPSAHTPSRHVPSGRATPPPPLPAPTLPTSNLPAPTLPAPQLPATQPPATQLPATDRPAPPARPPALSRTLATDVLVRPGDSLWSVAAARMAAGAPAARIAVAWPRWYLANRAEIGADPNHLTPGQVLHTPPEQETR
ncbi:MAG: hypothetical protein ABI301_08010 [Jatrophihabitantaceae bacterium]